MDILRRRGRVAYFQQAIHHAMLEMDVSIDSSQIFDKCMLATTSKREFGEKIGESTEIINACILARIGRTVN